MEYQIDDLTANEKMRYQFETNNELQNGEVIITGGGGGGGGTSSSSTSNTTNNNINSK